MYTHPDALVLVSAGNNGVDGTQTVVAPATSKSGVAVGASLNSRKSFDAHWGYSAGRFSQDSLAGFSSRGPTSDGRLKPEICGPGRRRGWEEGNS